MGGEEGGCRMTGMTLDSLPGEAAAGVPCEASHQTGTAILPQGEKEMLSCKKRA